jgi:hypothetical protein
VECGMWNVEWPPPQGFQGSAAAAQKKSIMMRRRYSALLGCLDGPSWGSPASASTAPSTRYMSCLASGESQSSHHRASKARARSS